ncbi:4532_t:CDS:1, partial [Scutellospora calospora]
DSLDLYGINKQKLKMNRDEPNWAGLRELNGRELEYYLPKNVNNIKNPEHFKRSQMSSKVFKFKIALNPFDCGAERSAFFGYDTIKNEKMVLKKYHTGDNSITRHLESSEISIIAYFLAEKFNSKCEKNNIKKKIRFIYSRVVTENNSENCYSIEYFLAAEYKKFNTNSGVITELHSTLEAFSHFTYDFTEKYLVVCDLQGAEYQKEFWLTDPAIHCIDNKRFG